MYTVEMNGNKMVGRTFDSKTSAQEYVKSCRAVDKRCGQKVSYKIVKCLTYQTRDGIINI